MSRNLIMPPGKFHRLADTGCSWEMFLVVGLHTIPHQRLHKYNAECN